MHTYACYILVVGLRSHVVSAYIQGRFRRNFSLSLSICLFRARARDILDVVPAFGNGKEKKSTIDANKITEFRARSERCGLTIF